MRTEKLRSFRVVLICLALPLNIQAKDNSEELCQRVLRASHLSRINDKDMKPWHLKFAFQLLDSKGKTSEQGTFEYWWEGPMLSKASIESPSYKATVINNRDGNYRSNGAGPFPAEIAALSQNIIYPMPMAEDLSRSVSPHLHEERRENLRLDCIQLTPKSPAPTWLQPSTYCFEEATDILRSIQGPQSTILRDKVGEFQGRSVALSLAIKTGKLSTATAQVQELSDISPNEGLFIPAPDMSLVKDAHAVKVIRR